MMNSLKVLSCFAPIGFGEMVLAGGASKFDEAFLVLRLIRSTVDCFIGYDPWIRSWMSNLG